MPGVYAHAGLLPLFTLRSAYRDSDSVLITGLCGWNLVLILPVTVGLVWTLDTSRDAPQLPSTHALGPQHTCRYLYDWIYYPVPTTLARSTLPVRHAATHTHARWDVPMHYTVVGVTTTDRGCTAPVWLDCLNVVNLPCL